VNSEQCDRLIIDYRSSIINCQEQPSTKLTSGSLPAWKAVTRLPLVSKTSRK
jgi:hypothetical protein